MTARLCANYRGGWQVSLEFKRLEHGYLRHRTADVEAVRALCVPGGFEDPRAVRFAETAQTSGSHDAGLEQARSDVPVTSVSPSS